MGKLSRQVRRSEARARQTRPLVSWSIKILVPIISLCIVAMLVWIRWQSQAGTSPPPVPVAVVRLPPGFTLCPSPPSPDVVVSEVQRFVSEYVRWYKTHPKGEEMSFEEYSLRWYVLVTQLRTLGLDLTSPLPTIRLFVWQRDRLNDYLAQRGRLFEGRTSEGNARTDSVWIAQIAAARKTTVVRFDHRAVPVRAYLINVERGHYSSSVQGQTHGSVIVFFNSTNEELINDVLTICRERGTGSRPMSKYVWADFRRDFEMLGDTDAFRNLLYQKFMETGFLHECQHVADDELLSLDTELSVSDRARNQFHSFGEARAALREMVHGSAPISTLGMLIVNWRPQVDSELHAATQIIESVLGESLDRLPLDAVVLRQRSEQALRVLDADYLGIVAHGHDPDPIKSYFQERKSNR